MDSDVLLRDFKFYLAARVTDEFLANPVDTEIRQIADTMGSQIISTFSVAGDTMDRRSWPSTWWDAVKERWYPKWALRLSPARHEYIEVRAYYPLVKLPKETNTVRIVDIR